MKEAKDTWLRIPTNVTDIKRHIMKVILAMRKLSDNGYSLCQTQFLNILHSQWGGAKQTPNITDNDKLRVFGLLMNAEQKDYILRQEGLFVR